MRDVPAESAPLGFGNDALANRVGPTHVARYESLAREAAGRVETSTLDRILPCDGGGCSLRGFLRRAFRRAPSEAEEARLSAVLAKAVQDFGPDDGRRLLIEAVLQSPQVLYLLEPPTEGEAPLSATGFASRLSYFLWQAPPDDALLLAAESGELETDVGLHAQVDRLLEDPRSEAGLRVFLLEWLHLGHVADTSKDPAFVPDLPDQAGERWAEALDQFLSDFLAGERSTLGELLTTQQDLRLPPELSRLYGEGPPVEERSGLLTHPAVLARFALPNQTSPVTRGLLVREGLLCDTIPPPPDGLEVVVPEPGDEDETAEDVWGFQVEDPACRPCHLQINPIGLGFEAFDLVGRYRPDQPVHGELVDSADPAIDGPFHGLRELGERLAASPRVLECAATRLLTFSVAAGNDDCCGAWDGPPRAGLRVELAR